MLRHRFSTYWNQTETYEALKVAQIKQKYYVKALESYKGNLLLVGINYNKDKKHSCVIEKVEV